MSTERSAKPKAAEFVCIGCGYGVSRSEPPEHCPICRGSRWRRPARLRPRPHEA